MRTLYTTVAALTLVIRWTSAQQSPFSNPLTGASPPQADETPLYENTTPFAENLVSTLSSSSQHTTLIRLLQRSKCIPLLAHIGNATLFAPTDTAWKEWTETHVPEKEGHLAYGWLSRDGLEEWTKAEVDVLDERIAETGDEEGERRKLDNQNWALRQHLLYHMLNYTLPPSAFIASEQTNVTTETTLLFPMLAAPDLPPTPPPGPPWLPRGGEGLLGGHGQRLRLVKAGSEKGGELGRIGVDFVGEGGAEIWDGSGWSSGNDSSVSTREEDRDRKKDRKGKGSLIDGAKWTRNGVVVGIEGVLEPPPSIDAIIRTHPSLKYLHHLISASSPLPAPIPDDLATTPHLTIFAPSNEAFDGAFDDVEKGYLEGGYGAEGVGRIVSGGVVMGVGKEQVGWRDFWGKKGYDVEAVSGLDLVVEALEGALSVNGTNATTVDIFASNGVIHILPTLLLPENFTLLNSAEKVLLSVNATRFVSLLRSANISSRYVGEPGQEQDKEEAWTILAPTDDVLDTMDKWGGHGAPLPDVLGRTALSVSSETNELDDSFKDASPLAALLQYHILPGRLSPSDIRDGMLVGTELRTSSLGGGRQRLRVDVSERLDRENWDTIGQGEIRFGGATVLGKPVKSGKSIIYLISSLLAPPDDVLQTAVSDLQLSTFIAAVYAADLNKALKKTPAVSYFMPRNRAFNTLGLGMKYLLLPEGKDELRKVIRNHAIDGIIYSSDVETGRTAHKTLGGGEIVISKINGTFELASPTKWEGHDSGEELPANGELRPAKIFHWNALTSTGVVHTIDSVEIPADVTLTITKLIRGSKQSTMADLMVRAGLEWILEGREPTKDEINSASLQGLVRKWGTDDEEQRDEGPDMESLALPSYTLLVPSDKALSSLNLTRYLSDKEALLDLLKLHIIPTQPTTPKVQSTKQPVDPPRDGQPISLADDLVYQTLLSGSSKFGDLAFRATGDNSFIVGIRNARSGANGGDVARIGMSGRASVRWKQNRPALAKGKGDDGNTGPNLDLWKGGMALGGGVMMIDSVLVPYEPSWFNRWGWLVITLSGIGVVVLVAVASFGWWWLTREKVEYEPLEGEEEE